MTTAISRSKVMQAAWKLVRAGLAFADAMRQAWQAARIALVREALALGVLLITFRKVDGTVTTRTATRNAAFIPDPEKPKGSGASTPAVLSFFSVTDNGWRCCRVENFIRFAVAA